MDIFKTNFITLLWIIMDGVALSLLWMLPCKRGFGSMNDSYFPFLYNSKKWSLRVTT